MQLSFANLDRIYVVFIFVIIIIIIIIIIFIIIFINGLVAFKLGYQVLQT